MSESDIPRGVSEFIAANIRSIEQVEILLLLRASPDQRWTPKEVYQRVLTNQMSIQQSLQKLTEQGLLRSTGEDTYQFAADEEIQGILGELAVLYKEKPARFLFALYGTTQSEIDAFAQAFRIRKVK
jgi:hypothetical protein